MMKKINLHTRPGLFSHHYPGGAPVEDTLNNTVVDGKVTISDPDQRVVNIHTAWRCCKSNIPFDLEFEIMELAQELLRPEIILATITSGIVCDMTVDLLFDSLKLGLCPDYERSTSLEMLKTLTETHEPGSRLRPAVKCYDVPKDFDSEYKIPASEFVLNWSRKRDGLRDLVSTMYIMYVGIPNL